MSLRPAIVFALFRNELRMILRDKRTIITAVLLPLIITPLMLAGSSHTRKKREATLQSKVYQFAITGTNVAEIRTVVQLTEERLSAQAKTNASVFKFKEVENTNSIAALNRGVLDFVLEGFIEESGSNDPPSEPRTAVRIVYRADRDDSSTGMDKMWSALERTDRNRRYELLQSRGFPVQPGELATVEKADLATPAHAAGLTLGKMITLFLLVFILSGGAIAANDLLAGEKERGTLETLLTTSASRVEIIAAKHLTTLSIAGFITVVQIGNLMMYVGFRVIPISTKFAAAITPGVALLLLMLFLPVAALLSSVLLLTSGFAKSYKEAQLYFLPVTLIAILPALAPMLPDVPLRSIICLMPIANIAIAAKEILIGWYDWPMIALAWLVTAGTGAWLTKLSVSFLSAERLITAGVSKDLPPTDGAGWFSRRVGIWFAILWAVVWIVNSYTATADVRVQVTVNLVGLFFIGSLLMLWRYKLNWRETLAFRAPKPAVWLGVLCGIPGGLLTASGLSRLTTSLVPVSPETMEEFSRAVIPEGVTLGELIFFLALLPGFFEEFTFRGLLLNGLSRRMHPVAVVIVVGLVFGIFHFALFRLVGTAFLGILFAALTLMTGSIFPAMIWHACNNALALITETIGIPIMELDWWMYGIGVVLLAMAFWIFWRERKPYPGLRWRRRDP